MDGEKKPGSDSVDARSWGKEALNPIKSQLMQEEIEQEKVRTSMPFLFPARIRFVIGAVFCRSMSPLLAFCFPAAAAHSQSICVAFLIVLSS